MAIIAGKLWYSKIQAEQKVSNVSSINILNNQISASIQLQVLGNSIIARVYPQGNDWTYLSYPSTYSVGASLTLIRPNFNASSKIYKPD